MTPEQISKAAWHDITATRAAAVLVTDYLSGIPAAQTLTTSAMLRGMELEVDTFNGLARHIGQARRSGLLDGYFLLAPANRGTFGKPSVLWHGLHDGMTQAEADAEVKRRLASGATKS